MKIVVISNSDLSRDPRVRRQIGLLIKAGHEIHTLAGKEYGEENTFQSFIRPSRIIDKLILAFFVITRQFKAIGNYDAWLNRYQIEALENSNPDIVIINDINALPIGLSIKSGKKILDAHEFSPGQYDDRFTWRFIHKGYLDYYCRKFLKNCHLRITVNNSIAELYREKYGYDFEVVMNLPNKVTVNWENNSDGPVRMVYHGGAVRGRKIEKMIRMMNYLSDDYTLDLMMIPSDKKYYKKLVKDSSYHANIRILEPVKQGKLIQKCTGYDIGLYLLSPTSTNNTLALPNKLFEYIQSGLCVAISPIVEMKKIVSKYQVGIISESYHPKDLAKSIKNLTRNDINRFKANSRKSSEALCFEKIEKSFLELLVSV